MGKNFTFFFIYIFTAFFLLSCYDSYDICTRSKTVQLKSGFYQIISGAETPSTVSSFTLQVVGGRLLYDKVPEISKFAASLDSTSLSMSFIIKVAEVLPQDTITVTYNNTTELVSSECGTVHAYNLTGITTTTHSIDSVKIASPAVITTAIENVKIYY